MKGRDEQNLDRIANDPRLRVRGWDGYDAEPLDERAVEAARRFLRYAWDAVPTNDGGVQLERHDSGLDMEISWTPEGALDEVFTRARPTTPEPPKEDK